MKSKSHQQPDLPELRPVESEQEDADAGTTELHPVPRKYLSLREAERYADVSRVTLWRWKKAGKLPVGRVGGRAWVRILDLDALIESGFHNRN